MVQCRICDIDVSTRRVLSQHVSKTHGLTFKQYVVTYELDGVSPVCACGCKEEVGFYNGKFKRYAVNGHHRKGVKESAETSQRKSVSIKRALAGDPNHRIKRQASMEKRWKDDYSTMRAILQKNMDGYLLNPQRKGEWSSHISRSVSETLLKGGVGWCKGMYFHPGKSVRIRNNFRSSYEHLHMSALDDDPTVLSWYYEPCSIPYEWEGKTKRYIPDFLVIYTDGRREFQEVGVSRVKESPRNIAKFEACRKLCASPLHSHLLENTTFRLITEQDHPEWVKP